MQITACITTRNATQDLDACLLALWSSSIKPDAVIVSDDSSNPEIQHDNRHVVGQYPGTVYLLGPQRGVCANRNCAVNAAPGTDLVVFLDDDVCVAPDFIANAIDRYSQMSPQERSRTLLTGGIPTKLSFRGFYTSSDMPEAINVHSAIFPRAFFQVEQWDEAIFFGVEEAELSLRALKRGYRIVHCPELKVKNIRDGQSPLRSGEGSMTDYQIYIEAARLYVGVKRYKELEPNPFKLAAFVVLYFSHMTVYLLRNRALMALPLILQQSHVQKLL